MKRLFPSLFCCCAILLSLAAADAPVELTGIFKTIDVRLATDTMKALRDSKGEAQQKVIGAIVNHPGDFAPPVLYVLSSVLFEQDKKDEALFWFYAGQLRGRIDANICADRSAGAAIAELNQRFGVSINRYSFTNLSLLTNTVDRVLAWEENTPCRYDRRWINLHGMVAMSGDTNAPMSAPKNLWETIRKRTRDDYRAEFQKALAEFSKRQR